MKKLLFVLFAVLSLAGYDDSGGVYEDTQNQKESSSDQVLLPYFINKNGQTLFELYNSGQLMLENEAS